VTHAAAIIANLHPANEVGEGVLHCYHPTGKFRTVDLLQTPWSRGVQYKATHSALMRIDWNGGFLGTPYVMLVALVERDGMVHAVVQADNAKVPRNPRCSLDQWVATQ